MVAHRKTAIMVGVSFIVATVAPILTAVFLGPLGGSIVGSSLSPDFLVGVSARGNQVMIGMLIELIWALSVVGIPVMLFPILKKHNEVLALGFFSLRSIEAITTVVRSIFLLSLLTVGREFAVATASDASYCQILGTLLLKARDWAFALGSGLVFTLSALVLNYVLYRSGLVPRWLSGWGFAAAALLLADCL